MADQSPPMAWAFIPARGGSKGVPGKNLKSIQGRTLVRRSVAAARSARRVSRIFVSTDDPAIAAEAVRAGAEVIDRPASISGDLATSEQALLHGLDAFERTGETPSEITVFIQCTSPFVTAGDIDGTVDALLQADADTAHTVVVSHAFLWKRSAEGGAVGVNHDKSVRVRRQDREPEYLETGAVYAMRTEGFRKAGHRFFGKIALYEMSPARALQIDTPDDLATARLLAPSIEPQIGAAVVPDPLDAILFDFDGVMTDNSVIVDENGVEAVTSSRSDGMGIALLKARNVRIAVISKERNGVVVERCRKLGLECVTGCDDKLAALQAICETWKTRLENVIYVGNDLPDIPCIEAAGLGVAVSDAHAAVRAAADMVTFRKGGQGAVRELCDLVLEALQVRD